MVVRKRVTRERLEGMNRGDALGRVVAVEHIDQAGRAGSRGGRIAARSPASGGAGGVQVRTLVWSAEPCGEAGPLASRSHRQQAERAGPRQAVGRLAR